MMVRGVCALLAWGFWVATNAWALGVWAGTDCDVAATGLVLKVDASTSSLIDCLVTVQYDWRDTNHTETLLTPCRAGTPTTSQLDICFLRRRPCEILLRQTAVFTSIWIENATAVLQLASAVVLIFSLTWYYVPADVLVAISRSDAHV